MSAAAVGVAVTGVAAPAATADREPPLTGTSPTDADPLAHETVEITELASGLRIVTERVPGALSVSAGVWVGVGARDEPAELNGVSHFLEHLLFKGTPGRTARDISAAVDRVGGEMNAFTTKEYTAYYTRLPAAELALGIELLGDVLTRPLLRDVDVESERQVILEELAMDDDAPEDVAHRLLAEMLFPDHPLGRETAGHPETVSTIPAEAVRAFHRRWYRPAAMVVAVAGPVAHETVVEEVSRHFDGGHGGERPVRAAPDGHPGTLAHERRRTEQVQIVLGYRGLGRTDPDRETLDVVNHVLGGGMSSRLFETVREEHGLAYAVGSSSVSYADAGALSVYAGTSPQHVTEVLGLVDAEIDAIAARGVTDDERDVAVGYLAGAYVLGLEDTGSRMARLGGSLTTYGYIRTVADQVARWRAVTHADIERVVARILDAPRTLSVVGPVTKRDASAWTR